MNYFELFYSLIYNFINFLLLDLFTTYFSQKSLSKKVNQLRLIFIIWYAIYSFVPHLPYNSIIYYSVSYLYIFILVDFKFKKSLILFLQFELFYVVSLFVTFFAYTYIIKDSSIQFTNNNYTTYKGLTCNLIIYILFSIYVCYKKLSIYKRSKSYVIQFSLIALLAIIGLSASTMILNSNIINPTDALPVVYSLLTMIVIICLSAYRKVTYTLQEQASDKMELEKVQLEQAYFNQIEDNLTNLHALRHDMKNHLIILNGYSQQHQYDKLESYLTKITQELTHSAYRLIETPSALISSLLNTKNQECIRNNIRLDLTYDFQDIFVDDYTITTILGNILDNAITAVSKLEKDRVIQLSIFQLDSILEIRCKNNHHEKIQKKGIYFITSKLPDASIHGLGIKNIEKAVERNNGSCDIQYNDKHFEILIQLTNYLQ